MTATLLYDQSRDVRTFASRRQEAAIQVSQRFTKATTGLFRFAYRRDSVSDVVIPVLLVPQLLQPVRLGLTVGEYRAGPARQFRRSTSGDLHNGRGKPRLAPSGIGDGASLVF